MSPDVIEQENTETTLLDTIKTTLETLAADTEYPMSGGVYYGVCTATTLAEWNYFVFGRRRVTPSNHKSYTDHFEVHIVHEDYIAEGYVLDVVKTIKTAIPGCSLDDNIEYEYTTKSDTNVIVEVATLPFKVARKVDDG